MNQPSQPEPGTSLLTMRRGASLLGLATLAAGILDLIWGNFDPGHQPIQSLGVHVPGRTALAYLAGIWLILAGATLLWRRTVQAGLWATAVIYFIFGLFSVPRFYTMTHQYGFHITVVLGVLGEMLLQFIVVAACLVFATSSAPPDSYSSASSRWIARCTFGLGGILFGMAHLVNVKGVVHMIPKWMPFGASFWVIVSGVAFLLAGAAILTGVLNVLAAHLLTLMLLLFEVVALLPILFGYPHLHQAWGASAYNLAAAGAAWIFTTSIAQGERSRGSLTKIP